jgi:glycosyltransferase involved in cell wall biosynthesis
MTHKTKRLSICIPTYKRSHLLERLIHDLSLQTVQPDALIVVDGDPEAGDVLRMLSDFEQPEGWRVIYVPSNHSQVSYQRYLGWKTATGLKAEGFGVFVYIDDDIRIHEPDTLDKIIAPLLWEDRHVVGVTPQIQSPEDDESPIKDIIKIPRRSKPPLLAVLFGSHRSTPLGGLSPGGHRLVQENNGQDYVSIDWLRGGVMAFRLDAMTENTFSEDLFAVDHIRCGLGDDTFISRRVGTRGELLLAFCAAVEHPKADVSRAYPYQPRRLAYTRAYSRRFLNDHYRDFDPPRISDRFALVKAYIGTTILNWLRALRSFRAYYYAYAWGYMLGAIRGLVQAPTAKNLTPEIDWWEDAERALAELRVVKDAS